jgi:hypothetical protein
MKGVHTEAMLPKQLMNANATARFARGRGMELAIHA